MRFKLSLPARLTALVPSALACVLIVLAGFVASGKVWTQEPAQQPTPAPTETQQPAATPTDQTQAPAQTNAQTPAQPQDQSQSPQPAPTTDATEQQTPAPTEQQTPAPTEQQTPAPTDGSQATPAPTTGTTGTPVAGKSKPKVEYKQVKLGPKDAEDIAKKDPDGAALIDAGAFSEPDAGASNSKTRRTTEITEEELRALLLKKELYIRGNYLNDTLEFNEHGGLVGKSPVGSYTLSNVEIEHITMTKHKIILEGTRYGLHFLGNLGDEDKNVAMIKLTPPKKKKTLTITIDREVVVQKPKEKAIKIEEPKTPKLAKGKKDPCAGIGTAPVPELTVPVAPTETPAPPPGEGAATPAPDATTNTSSTVTDATPDATTPQQTADATQTPTTTPQEAAPAPQPLPTDTTTAGSTAATGSLNTLKPTPKAQMPCYVQPSAADLAAAAPPDDTPKVEPAKPAAPELTPEEQARAEVLASIAAAKPEERPADANSVTHTYSPVHASRVLRQALDRVFAVGLDAREMDAMPDMWKHYYESQANKAFYKFQDPTLVKLSEVDTRPVLLKGIEPDTNAYAQENGIVGISRYRAVIGPDGKASDIAITLPIGFGLDENAAAAIRKATFKPATKGGQPVATALDLYITFRIYSKMTSPTNVVAKDPSTLIITPAATQRPGPYTIRRQAAATPGVVQQAIPTTDAPAPTPQSTPSSALPGKPVPAPTTTPAPATTAPAVTGNSAATPKT